MATYAESIIEEFNTSFKIQTEWNWLLAIAFFLGGVGAGLFLVSSYLSLVAGQVLGILLVTIGKGGAHLLYLGRPLRAWRAFTQAGHSWISRGLVAIAVFTVTSILYVAPYYEWFTWLPWTPDSAFGRTCLGIAMVSAFGVIVYTGFVMAYSASIPFWNSSLIPIAFLVSAILGGSAIVLIMVPFIGETGIDVKFVETLELFMMGVMVLVLMTHLVTMYYSTLGAKESVRLLTVGRHALLFMGGVIGMGLILPLAAGLYFYFALGGSVVHPAIGVAALLELVGGYLFRYSLFKAGVYNPVY